MLMRCEVVQPEHQQNAEAEPGHYGQSRSGPVAKQLTAGFQSRQDQRKCTGCQHHPGRETQHAVLAASREVAQADRQKSANSRGNETGAPAQHGVANVAGLTIESVDTTGHQQ